MDIGTTCCICHEEITSFVNLSGKRCVWCQRTVHESSPSQFITHSECVDALGTYCDFGCHAPYIISPSYVQSPFDSTRPRPNPSPSSQSPPPSQPVLHRALSDHDRPSLAQPLPLLDPASSELRCRRGSDTSDGDDLSIGASPPPNLTEYRVRDFSDRFLPLPSEKELEALQEKAGDNTSDSAGNNTEKVDDNTDKNAEKAADKSEPFSWQSVLKDLK